ncbi:hypothetical protein REPUB_Repub19eG0115300 [Reevesia pubescens]
MRLDFGVYLVFSSHNKVKPEAVIFVMSYVAAPEIEQGLSDAAHSKITISFTTHLMLMAKKISHDDFVKKSRLIVGDNLVPSRIKVAEMANKNMKDPSGL